MLHIIKVGSQIQINDFGLLFNDCLCYPANRFMCRSFRSVSVRSCLEVRFEDRFQNELEGSLDHAITDGRNRENSDFSPVFWYFLLLCYVRRDARSDRVPPLQTIIFQQLYRSHSGLPTICAQLWAWPAGASIYVPPIRSP